jgi:carboxylesterase
LDDPRRPSRTPYVLGPAEGRPALLLHGLTGSPWDLRPLAEALAAHGYRAKVPRLHGHEDLESLAASTWRDWYRSASTSLAQLSSAPVLLIGFSMGALLALRLASHHAGALAGLVVMGVPIQHPRWQLLGSQAVASLQRHSPWLATRIGYHPKPRSDVRSQLIAGRRAAFPAVPYTSVAELGHLQDEVRGLLRRVSPPTLLLHGAYDHVAPVEGSAQVSQALGASYVRRVVLANSCHHIVRDLDRQQVRDEVLGFALGKACG